MVYSILMLALDCSVACLGNSSFANFTAILFDLTPARELYILQNITITISLVIGFIKSKTR